jgi:hypothetical protein
MQYKTLKADDILNGYRTRIGQLEAEHFTNSVHIFEADLLGLTNESEQLKKLNESIVTRIAALEDKVTELETDPGDDN